MPDDELQPLSREDFEHALEDMGRVVDVSVNDLIELTAHARKHAMLRRRETVLIDDLMSHPVHTVATGTTLAEAADKMLRLKISGLPVVDNAGRLKGLITEADFLRAIGVPCHHPVHNLWRRLGELFSAAAHELHEPAEPVESVMMCRVVTLSPGQTLHDALEAMKSHQVKRLVVVDGQHIPVGMITRSDLVRAFFRRLQQRNDDAR